MAMNISFNSSPAEDPKENISGHSYNGGIGTQIGFSLIAILCIVGNLLVFILFLYSRKLRNFPHGVLIWNLALVDFLTGIFIIVTPEHIIREAYVHPPPGLAGQLFCMIIGSEIFTFGFGFISMYTLCVLSIERRYAVVKMNLHARYFTMKRTKWTVLGVWIWGLLLVFGNLFQSHYVASENPPCIWQPLPGGQAFNTAIYLVLFCFRFLFPMTCVITCYTDIWRYMRSTIRNLQQHMDKKATAAYRVKNRITLTCAVTSLAFLLCWLPNVIYFTLANLGVAFIGNDGHFATKLLILLNSCINPFIYASTNQYYRAEFVKLLVNCKCIHPKTTSNTTAKSIHITVDDYQQNT
ncbi:Somatostatin receptor type 1 [Trichoplax sp. H2]|nr:Somatostatin receptor type 1 [Trichoplax sp. H2]|eukprot:RDD39783.1 Somatostatin receptor type 1 [Trichoplax sp. H2]